MSSYRSAFAVVTWIVCILAWANAAKSQDIATRPGAQLISFDIEAQPLASALGRYGDLTGREVFYDAQLGKGRRSNSVRGVFTAGAAIDVLLSGTGLSAHFLEDGSFVLLPTPPSREPAVQAASDSRQMRYYALIQASLRDTFCRSRAVRPGRYRVVALLWIAPSGIVDHYQRLGSAGAPDIDKGIDETLGKLQLSEPPPPGFTQPILTMIIPWAAGVTMDCDANPRPISVDR